MLSSGISVVEHAYEWVGLVQATEALRLLLLDGAGVKIIFLLGMFLALVRVVRGNSLRPLFIFLGIFFSLWFLVVIPRISVVPLSSVTEARGPDGGFTSRALLEKLGLSGALPVSPLLEILARTGNTITNGIIATMTRWSPRNLGYLDDPFALSRWQVRISREMRAGISDPQLRQRLVQFLRRYYFPALALSGAEDGALSWEASWPGAATLVARYGVEGQREWAALRSGILSDVHLREGLRWMVGSVHPDKNIEEDYIRALLSWEIRAHKREYTRVLPDDAPEGATPRPHPGWAEAVLQARPVMYGILLWTLWLTFPLSVVAMVVVGEAGIGMGWLKWAVLIKTLPLFWAVIDMAAYGVFVVLASIGDGRRLWDMPQVGTTAAAGILLVPACWLLAGAGLAGRRT